MMLWKRWASRVSFHTYRSKVFLALLPTSLLPLIVSLVLVLNLTGEHAQKQRIESLLANAEGIYANLEKRLEQIRLVDDMLVNYITTQVLRSEYTPAQNYAALTKYESIHDYIVCLQLVYEIARVRVYCDKIPYSRYGDFVNTFKLNDIDPLAKQFPQLLTETGRFRHILLPNQSIAAKNYDLICFYHSIYDIHHQLTALFFIDLDINALLSSATDTTDNASVFITDAKSSLVCANTDAMLPASSTADTPYRIEDEHLVFTRPLAMTGWTLTVSMPLAAMSGIEITLSEVYIAIICVTFVLILLASLLLSRMLTRRLHVYYAAVQNADIAAAGCPSLPDELERIAQHGRYRDEVDDILCAFSTLIRDNLRLMEQQKQHEVDIARYKFQVLQEQINPHFLYNALETLRLCMVVGRREDAVHTLEALSRFYRIALSKGHDTISIREELRMIECYLEIENVGYDGRLRWEMLVEDLCGDMYIPKFLIQPLIENAIVHGRIVKGKDFLSILIDIRIEDEMLVILVQNDGVGFPVDILKEIRASIKQREPLRQSPGFGLKNIIHRLKLFYGESSGVVIDSDEQSTRIVLQLPLPCTDDPLEKPEAQWC